MAQGKLKAKIGAPSGRKAGRKAAAQTRVRKNVPKKQIRRLRDVGVTKLLHKNMETIIAGKAIRNDGRLRIKELHASGKEQVKMENKERIKKRKTKADAQALQLQNAQKRTVRQ